MTTDILTGDRIFFRGSARRQSENTIDPEILNLNNLGSGPEHHYFWRWTSEGPIYVDNCDSFYDAGLMLDASGVCVVETLKGNPSGFPSHSVWVCLGVTQAGFARVVDPIAGRILVLPPKEPTDEYLNGQNREFEIFGDVPRTVALQEFYLISGPATYTDLHRCTQIPLTPFVEMNSEQADYHLQAASQLVAIFKPDGQEEGTS